MNAGVIVIDPSSVAIASLTGMGNTTIEANSTLDVTGTVSAGETITLAAASAVLQIDPTQFSGQVNGFAANGTIELNGISNAVSAQFVNGNTLEIARSSGSPLDLTLDPAGNYAAVPLNVTGNSVTALCFLRGTAIRTDRGEVPVQDLAVGDTVLTLSGAVRPIAWIGIGRVMIRPGQRCAATPVLIRKGAIAPNVPYQDLRVTKGHSLYLDGVLIPAEYLVNHRSILWDDHAQVAEFYHIELGTHDILLANGAASESYRDDGNRWLFQNARTAPGQPPKPPFAPVETGGPTVDAVWQRLLDRAGARPGMPTTTDPDLHLLVDGHRLYPTDRHGTTAVFRLARHPGSVRVVSRAGVPAELGLARDGRNLGVAVRQVAVWQGARVRVLDLANDHPMDGFHDFEADGNIRWTDGDATLPATLFDGAEGALELTVHIAGQTQYPDSAAQPIRKAG